MQDKAVPAEHIPEAGLHDPITVVGVLMAPRSEALVELTHLVPDVPADDHRKADQPVFELTGVLGILLDLEDEIPEEIRDLANKRAEAKKAKDYAEADRIRDEIQAKGYTVKDVPGGFKIEKAN